jgi:hypothetical protein
MMSLIEQGSVGLCGSTHLKIDFQSHICGYALRALCTEVIYYLITSARLISGTQSTEYVPNGRSIDPIVR